MFIYRRYEDEAGSTESTVPSASSDRPNLDLLESSHMARDPYDNVLVQLIGSKSLTLIPRGDEGMYPFPRNTLQSNTSQVRDSPPPT